MKRFSIRQSQNRLKRHRRRLRTTTSVSVVIFDYDHGVNNDQREVIYAERRRVLNGESMRDVVYKMIKDVVADDVEYGRRRAAIKRVKSR